jgi:putative pyruvate formate lyase activating enzyme
MSEDICSFENSAALERGLWPSYLALYESGELARRADEARGRLAACDLCPRRCGTDRLGGQAGFCGAPADAVVASHNRHDGEEPPISGTRGSGTIFFSHCTLRCVFCQNYPISQQGVGRRVGAAGLAEMFLDLQKRGCHNVNFVTPTHYVPEILAALLAAIPRGFRLPLVYNTSGFESLETLALLDGVIDIYLPDIKYADDKSARRLSAAPSFVETNRAALREMWRQVGPLDEDDEGVARRGLIVRHLVLPHQLAGTRDCLEWLAREIGPAVHVSLMSQYFPANRAEEFDALRRRVTEDEYAPLTDLAFELGFPGWIQPQE